MDSINGLALGDSSEDGIERIGAEATWGEMGIFLTDEMGAHGASLLGYGGAVNDGGAPCV